MTYEDNLTGRIEAERIDRLAEWLEATIGPALTAFATAASTSEVARIAHGDEGGIDFKELGLHRHVVKTDEVQEKVAALSPA